VFVRCFFRAGLIGLHVGALAAIGAGASSDPFVAMSMLGAYVTILAAIVGGVLLALALSASACRLKDRDEGMPPS